MTALILPAGLSAGAVAYWAFFALVNRVGGPRG